MDGNGPSEFHGHLYEAAIHFFLDFTGLFVKDITSVDPFFGFHIDQFVGLGLRTYGKSLFGDTDHFANHAVVVTLVGIVLDEHHLRAEFEGKYKVGGVSQFGKVAFHLGGELIFRLRDFMQTMDIDFVGFPVMGDQADVSLAVVGFKVGHIAAVEGLQHLGVRTSLTNGIEQCQESLIALTIDLFEFHRDEMRFLQSFAAEEIGGVIVFVQQFPLLVLHHGSQLLEVADEQKLYTTKRATVAAMATQGIVDGVQHVGTHHTDFINHQKVDAANQTELVLRHPIALLRVEGSSWHIGGKGKLEERMERDAIGIDGCNTCGGKHDDTLCRLPAQMAQKGCLSRTGPSGKEKIGMSVFYDFTGSIDLWIIQCDCGL